MEKARLILILLIEIDDLIFKNETTNMEKMEKQCLKKKKKKEERKNA